jgi:hypothetical protein
VGSGFVVEEIKKHRWYESEKRNRQQNACCLYQPAQNKSKHGFST